MIKTTITCGLISLLLAGCAKLPTDYERTVSSAFPHHETTTLGRTFLPMVKAHGGQSGFLMLEKNDAGFQFRLGLADIAEKTIDVQYYIWKGDTTGRIFAERLIRAADRGVRVRILLDDITSGKGDFKLAFLNTHPRIEVRLFNPFGQRSLGGIGRTFELVGNVTRLRHRMHNKLFAVDNAAAVIGGRNIGNEYFGVNPDMNHLEMDLMAVGPAVRKISASFDAYWNSDWAIPISAFNIAKPTGEQAEAMYERLHTFVAEQKDFPYDIEFDRRDLLRALRALRDDVIWADSKVVYDTPDKVAGEQSRFMGDKLDKLGTTTEKELLVITPYFSPGADGVQQAGALHARGVTVRVLTNSLAATVLPVAHSVYAKYRRELLENGVELYEYRPDVVSPAVHAHESFHDARSSLHAKVMIFDRRTVFIGSYNFNQAGLNLSTEIALVVYSPELSRRIAEFFEDDMTLKNSWRVIFHDVPKWERDPDEWDVDLVWITEEDGKEVRYIHEPAVSLWRGIQSTFYSLFPLKEKI